jgi:hypothetical protein
MTLVTQRWNNPLAWTSRPSCNTTDTGGWPCGPSELEYVGLSVAIAGLIAMSLGSTRWILAAGVITWLAAAAAAVTLAGFFWSRHELPEPRSGYWSMRFMIIHDTVYARSPYQRS